jgi:drug/metabolite transporter (DMT)-like permease
MSNRPTDRDRRPASSPVLIGFLFALAAGALWGTTGPLSTALYDLGAEVTDVGFWRVLLATVGFLVYAWTGRASSSWREAVE